MQSSQGITLLGGGELGTKDIEESLRHAPDLVAADSGAAAALSVGHMPLAVIGDMDSLSAEDQARMAPGTLHHIPEQDSTDFDKVTRRVSAPFCIGVGFLGLRADHQLANFNTLVRTPELPCILAGVHDVIFAAPAELELLLPERTRVSLFPLAPVSGRSDGLHWPIEGLPMSPSGVHGTSNRVAEGADVTRLWFDAPGMLVILPRSALEAALRAVRSAPRWPSPAL